jgi:hypothetical protein
LEELLQEQIYDENDRMEKEAGKIARWVTRKWKLLRKQRQLEAAGKKGTHMGDVVLDAMAAHENDTAGEQTFLLQKDRKPTSSESEGGILGFFQSFTRQSNDDNGYSN